MKRNYSRRMLSLLLVLAMVMTMLPALASTARAETVGYAAPVRGSGDITDQFTDLKPGAWYLEDVAFAVENGLMVGNPDGTFAPKGTVTRAQVVQVLYAMSGIKVTAESLFTDAPASKWYGPAITWAVKTGVSSGTSETTFSPNKEVTRQDLMCMLFRYANVMGWDTSGATGLPAYEDVGKVSKYAVEAMAWAFDNGLITGLNGTTLGPKQTTNRAQLAAFLHRFSNWAYPAESAAIYDEVLGEFYAAYEAALAADSISERYALMAVAEAKLLESGVMLPMTTSGGNYAISRVVPNTTPYVMWGNDAERCQKIMVVDGDPITAADRAEMKALWAEVRGTGTYETRVKALLKAKGYTLADTYTLGYSSDPKTWDILATSRSADLDALVQISSGLFEYDMEGRQSPALAESVDISADGLTYTFHLRSDAVWVDSLGRKVASVRADDFVAGMQHALDAEGSLEFLVWGIIANAAQYVSGEITDFTKVGVKALDDRTLVYTLEAPCPYFMTMLGYGLFAPLCRSYYRSQGGAFGEKYDPNASTYLYGMDPDHILYSGPFLVTRNRIESEILFTANHSYWNYDGMNVHTVYWLYNDGSDPTKSYNDMKAGVLAGAGLNFATLEVAKADGMFDVYGYVSATNATSYMAFMNVNRAAFVNANDGFSVPTPKTEEDIVRAQAAMRNVHFRMAVNTAVDRGAYNAQSVGEDRKLTNLRNSYTPGNFVSLPEEVTVNLSGIITTFPAGTFYGAVMQAQLDADGVAIKVYDPTADDGMGSSDGFDGWYNPMYAKAELSKAIQELAAQGIEISAANPIYLDLPYPSNSASYTNKANAYKQSVEASLGGAVIVNLTECVDFATWYYTGAYTGYGYEANYDVYDLPVWAPDYGDPRSYLDTFLPDYAGYMVKCIGIF